MIHQINSCIDVGKVPWICPFFVCMVFWVFWLHTMVPGTSALSAGKVSRHLTVQTGTRTQQYPININTFHWRNWSILPGNLLSGVLQQFLTTIEEYNVMLFYIESWIPKSTVRFGPRDTSDPVTIQWYIVFPIGDISIWNNLPESVRQM